MNAPGIKMNIFSYRKHSERVYVVTEAMSYLHRFTIGVVIGEEKIIVIDSGMGMTRDLRKYIEFIVGEENAKKPMICLLSHGALDHAGSANLFDEAHMNHLDWDRRYTVFANIKKRLDDLPCFSLGNPDFVLYCQENFNDNREVELLDLLDGEVYDAGGITVEVIATPGHSAGHCSFFIPEEKVCFTGDAVNTDGQISPERYYNMKQVREEFKELLEIPVDAPELTMQETFGIYGKMVRKLIAKIGDDCTLYSGHMFLPMPIRVAYSYAEACDDICAGDVEGDPPGESIFPYQMNAVVGVNRRMHWIGNVDVMYNANLLDKNLKK